MSLFKKIVTALHRLRGYHCGRAAIFEQSFTTATHRIVQVCRCGDKRETFAYVDAKDVIIPYRYWWTA